MRVGLAIALAALAGCGRDLPPPGDEERVALARAAVVPSAPSPGCRPGVLPAVRGERRRLRVGGVERSYLLDAPAGPADRALPVVVSLHGFRSSAWRHRWWSGWGTLALEESFVAVHPEGHEGVELLRTTGRGWDFRRGETRDVDFIRALLDVLEEGRCIDRRRLFATGMSNGGFFANLLGCALADRLTAVAPVAGALALPGCTPAAPMPVLLVYGRADRVVPAELIAGARRWWAGVDGCGAPLERDGCLRYAECDLVYCEGPQGHRWPADATARIWRFFRAHPRRS